MRAHRGTEGFGETSRLVGSIRLWHERNPCCQDLAIPEIKCLAGVSNTYLNDLGIKNGGGVRRSGIRPGGWLWSVLSGVSVVLKFDMVKIGSPGRCNEER